MLVLRYFQTRLGMLQFDLAGLLYHNDVTSKP